MRHFIDDLQKRGELAVVRRPVDPRHLFIMLWASTQFYSDFEPVAIDALKTSRLKAGDYDKAAATIAETILRGILPCS